MNHRPDDSECLAVPPPGACDYGGSPSNCSSDNDCTQGNNGRCLTQDGVAAAVCDCAYDTCTSDSACPTKQTCACHGTPYSNQGNTCVPGDCRVDSDCGLGGYCSPSPITGDLCPGGLAGFYCHTPSDTCTNDTDCAYFDGGTLTGCAYAPTDHRWECASLPWCEF